MHTLYIHRTAYHLPSSWQELSRRQLVTVAELITANLDPVRFAKLMVLVLTQSLPWWKRMRVRFFFLFQATIEEKADMMYLTHSFLENRGFTQQKLKNIGDKNVLSGPASALANITLWEFISAEKAFLEYVNGAAQMAGPDKARLASMPDPLDKLIAILYRPRRTDYEPDIHADPRVPLVDAAVPDRMRQVSRIPHAEKIAILMWFDGCRSHIIRMFPLIFRKESESPIQSKLSAGAKPPTSNSNWIDLISSLATDMTQFEQIANTNLIIAFTDLSNRIRQSRKQKQK